MMLAPLRRREGATIEQMMKATGWQAHSVRGAISGALKKRQGLSVASAKTGDSRIYGIVASGKNQFMVFATKGVPANASSRVSRRLQMPKADMDRRLKALIGGSVGENWMVPPA